MNNIIQVKSIFKFVKPYFFPLWRLWIRFGIILGVINSTILLTCFYYIVISPISIIRRVIYRGTWNRMHSEDSFWISREHKEPTLEHYRRQF